MGDYPGLRGWALKVIARVPIRRRQEWQSKRRGEDSRSRGWRDRPNVSSGNFVYTET